ncbi:hypothetical protein D3C80_931800 [compost metagenome]
MHSRIDHLTAIGRITAHRATNRIQRKTQTLLVTGHQMQAALDQVASGQLLTAIAPAHMPRGSRRDIGDAHRHHGIQQPQVFHADGQLQLAQLQAWRGFGAGQQLIQPIDKGPRRRCTTGETIHIELEAEQLGLPGVWLAQGDVQGLLQGPQLLAELDGTVGMALDPLRAPPRAHGLDRRLQRRVVQPWLPQRAAQSVDDHQQAPVDPLFTT